MKEAQAKFIADQVLKNLGGKYLRVDPNKLPVLERILFDIGLEFNALIVDNLEKGNSVSSGGLADISLPQVYENAKGGYTLAVGYPLNSRQAKYYDYVNKGFDVSALSFHKMLAVAHKLDALNEWSSVVALTYIGAQRVYPFYTDMADFKATLESIARTFGYHYGKHKKVRINTISQSPTKTTAGSGIKGFSDFYTFAEMQSPLGNASAEDCANYTVSLFSDLTRMVTMQNLFHDGGYSSTGVSQEQLNAM